MSCYGVKMGYKAVKPVYSLTHHEAHRRVMGLYRGFYRYIPYIIKYHDIPKNEHDVRMKIRQFFYANACVTDIRIIDILVIKGYMELREITHQWQQKGHVMANWCPTYEAKSADFICKFLDAKP